MVRGLLAIWVLCFLMMNAGETYAQKQKEPVGRWRYKDDTRPVKVIVIGGSLAHWGKGNFGSFLAHLTVDPRSLGSGQVISKLGRPSGSGSRSRVRTWPSSRAPLGVEETGRKL